MTEFVEIFEAIIGLIIGLIVIRSIFLIIRFELKKFDEWLNKKKEVDV